MKLTKLFFLAGTLFAFSCFNVNAQSQRVQLLEYFDNTSIPPFGAVANANVDSLITNYSGKIACIKYHVAWGSQTGTDPMNLHNPGQAQLKTGQFFTGQGGQGGGVLGQTAQFRR